MRSIRVLSLILLACSIPSNSADNEQHASQFERRAPFGRAKLIWPDAYSWRAAHGAARTRRHANNLQSSLAASLTAAGADLPTRRQMLSGRAVRKHTDGSNSTASEAAAAAAAAAAAPPATRTSLSGEAQLLRIHLSAIHVERAEFPLKKLLFKLALRLALGSVSKQLELEHRVKLVLSIRSANTCSHQFAGAIAAEEYYTKRARLFIVSGCDDAIRGVSRLASLWQVPIMTAAGFGADLDDKSVHKTLVRLAFSLKAAVEFLFKVLRSFQWRRVNLIVDESDENSQALRRSIEDYVKLMHQNVDSNATSEQMQSERLQLNIISLNFKSLAQPPPSAASNQLDSAELLGRGVNTSSRSQLGDVPAGWGRAQEAGADRNSVPGASDRWPNELMQRVLADKLTVCSMFSRVSIILIPQKHLRKFMLSVYDQNMANGLYTFINMPLILDSLAASNPDNNPAQSLATSSSASSYSFSTGDNIFQWRSTRSARNAHAKKAFESLMSIYLRIPSTKSYLYFANRLSELANSEYASTTFSNSSVANKTLSTRRKANQLDINPYLASFYDSLQIYAIALRESLAALKLAHLNTSSTPSALNTTPNSLSIHANISELVRDRRFDNMITGQLYINSNGDRETDYTLDDMNHMTGKFAPIMLYNGKTRSIERLGRIHWSSDASIGPTTDNIDCNLTNTCIGKPMTRFVFILMLMAGPLLLIVSSVAYFVYVRLTLESQLVDHWWKIHMSEIELVLTRRKNANDGSLVMNSTVVADEAAIASGTGIEHVQSSRSSSHGQARKPLTGSGNESVATSASATGAAARTASLLISTGGKFKSKNVASAACDKTEITKVTNKDTSTSVGLWGQNSSIRDVCYGNITLGIYKQAKVALKPIAKFHQSRKLMIELRSIKDVNHSNLCRFIGIIVDEGSWGIVNEFCPKGSLREFFNNESMVIDWTFKYSIINDIVAGLNYLHSSPMEFHGRLKSSNCLVSARFVVKLSDYGPHLLYEQVDTEEMVKNTLEKNARGGSADDEHKSTEEIDRHSALLKKRIWLAPEHMLSSSKSFGSMKGDVYSFGLLLYEIITNTPPFIDNEKNDFVIPLESLHDELRNHGPNELTGPNTSDIILSDEKQNIEPLVELMRLCWNYEPSKRPSLQDITTSLKKITRGVTSKKLLENLTTRMEQYTNNLESLIEGKLATLVEEKLKTEELLYQFVPRSIASVLKDGRFVQPEAFECVTVFYSDIVGFTSLSAESSPMEVVDFLSDLYLCFDETLEQHDIFKVDTIGDAYIVASGLPQRNEDKHVIEIACAALEIRDRLREFKIPHKPGRSLEMRVGIHSGPCVAGIVGGLNMPKYCVFGDTLTTGKFMESTGLPMKIHITEESKNLLSGIDRFTIEARQPVIARDGLPFQTYWLERDNMNQA